MPLFASDKVEVYASSIETKDGVVYANEGVRVIYKEYFLTSKRAIYHKDSGDLELFDDIKVNYKGQYKVIGNYAKMNLANKEHLFQPFYMLDNTSEVWMNGEQGYSKQDDIEIATGMVSGCDPIDPMWKIAFSSSDYNAKTKWLNIYNARFYLYDLPVFYTPYFGYSLDTTRRTGLLMPTVGLSASEGLYYQQPIYIAESNWWDLEFRPQVRTLRGKGLYSDFRFVDSKYSKGSINIGGFRENDSYFTLDEVSLKNQQHYGVQFKYTNSNVLNHWFNLDLQGQSGLYADIAHMNDVEYINLATNNTNDQVTANQVISRINGFYNTDDNYLGTYVKYYQNLDTDDNSRVIQQLPTLHYHHYMESFLQDHIISSLDIQSKNLARPQETNAVQTDINLPVIIQTSLFDEYLNVSYKANIYMQHSAFFQKSGNVANNGSYYDFRDGYFLRNFHTLQASTQLTKGYDSFIHVAGLSVSYNRSAQSKEVGYYEDNKDFCSQDINKDNPICEFYNINRIQDEASFDFTQYFYGLAANEIVYHRLSQKVSYESGQDRLGELENELDWKVTNYFSLYNNTFYNHTYQRFTKVFNSARYRNYGVNLSLSYLFKFDIAKDASSQDPYTKYLTSSLNYDYNKHYSFSAVYNYDVELEQRKTASIGFMYKKRCWDFGIRYSENNRPILDEKGNSSSVYDKYIYISVVLKPIMQASANDSLIEYRLPNKK